MRAVPALALSAALALGCAQVQETVADLVLPPEQAAALGNRLAQQVEAKQELHPSDALQGRVSRIGRQVLAAADDVPQAYDFSFKVLQEPNTVNAFALPGGQIYVTSGLVQAAGSDAQLAAVLAHEVAHVTQRHVADRLAAQYGTQLLSSVALGGDAGALSQMAAGLLQQGALLKYSRSQELEADSVGLDLMREAGYNPRAALAMFRKLEGDDGGRAAPVFLSTHPAMSERIERIEQALAQ